MVKEVKTVDSKKKVWYSVFNDGASEWQNFGFAIDKDTGDLYGDPSAMKDSYIGRIKQADCPHEFYGFICASVVLVNKGVTFKCDSLKELDGMKEFKVQGKPSLDSLESVKA